MGPRLSRLALLLLSPFSPPSLVAQQTAPPPKFDAYVAQVLRTFRVPGVAVAIVKDGKVVWAKGYGVRTKGDSTPVDARTRFGIASPC
ncbi:MAG TPA: serine hydrolase domain-containing protein [Gemmatimonadales bacterium]|jgi:CubicO group peptidase (beta-lactamase class C family)